MCVVRILCIVRYHDYILINGGYIDDVMILVWSDGLVHEYQKMFTQYLKLNNLADCLNFTTKLICSPLDSNSCTMVLNVGRFCIKSD